MIERIIPVHCNDCTWFFSKMGACPHPDVSMLFSYLSLLPYFIIFYLIVITFLKRTLSLIRLTTMLMCAYMIGDRLLKNVFQSILLMIYKGHRPPFSCKNTYGMPSSHMTVIVAVTFCMFGMKEANIYMKLGMIVLCILQGIARVELHYHTYEQVLGGVIFGILFSTIYFMIFNMIWIRIKSFIPRFIGIRDDLV